MQQAVPLLSASRSNPSVGINYTWPQLDGMVITEKSFLICFHTFPHITHSRHHRTMQFLSPLSLPDMEKLISLANEWCIIFRFPHVT